MNDMNRQLIEQAKKAAHNGYAPYSQHPRGAALQAADGEVFCGAAVECAAYPGSICAELGALSAAVAAGKRDFQVLALWPYRMPCGACRQSYREFGLTLKVIAQRDDGTLETRTLEQLLPNSFGPSHLGQLREACDPQKP